MEERGSIVPLVAAVVGVAMLAVIGVVELSGWIVDRARAQVAADAAALAGVVEGRPGAGDLAELNGGSLLSYRDDDGRVDVVVRVGSASALASADWDGQTSGAPFVPVDPLVVTEPGG
ncbi:MAG: pilus assembly protein TadG-related protein [Acidimicrobiales bacterium]